MFKYDRKATLNNEDRYTDPKTGDRANEGVDQITNQVTRSHSYVRIQYSM
jgi:hypothetical protein